MRTEINVITNEVTTHEDYPTIPNVSTEVVKPQPTVEQLQAQLAEISAQLQALQGAN